jgi:hypothetical protein
MSHVVKLKTRITSLVALKKAAESLGMEMVEQPTYAWYGTSVGDYALPAGFSAKDLGKCKYAIKIPNNSRAYQIGVVPARTDKGEPVAGQYELLFDFWSGGYGLMDKVGKDACKLTQSYKIEVAKSRIPLGWSIKTTVKKDGTQEIRAVKY